MPLMGCYQKERQSGSLSDNLSLTTLNSMDKQHPQTVARRVLGVAYGSLSESDDRIIRHDLDVHTFHPITEYYCLLWLICRDPSGAEKSTQDVFVSNKDAVFANPTFQMTWKDLIHKEEVMEKKGKCI